MKSILVTVHIVQSVFGFQLGEPVFQVQEYPNEQVCQHYAKQSNIEGQIDQEYTLVKRGECIDSDTLSTIRRNRGLN